MISAAEAWQTILARAARLETVRLPLAGALNRILHADARADADSPPFDASAMDGYALRRTDAARSLRVAGAAQAGDAFTGTLGAGECVRILTGAPVPAGVDCVVRQEEVVREGDFIQVRRHDGPDFIRRRGENYHRGDVVVPAGTRLGPPELAALATAGVHQPEVVRAPRCAHLVTGNELVSPDQTPAGAQIRDSNSTLIAALLVRHGAELAGQVHVRDDLPAARAAVAAMPAHDVLLISGGASVGDLDLARPLLQALGYTLHFHVINLRPGKPLVFASRGTQLAFVLPGNPVSHWVVFQLFLAPLLDHLQTGSALAPARLTGRLASNGQLPLPDTRQTFWPCRAVITNGTYELTPLPLASSGDSSGLVGANALLPVPPPPGNLASGQSVEFILCP
ncbi:MAG TPA: molybdopterin molybdotransferase MoeA [Lacunisphaera sp.]|nr:molybdopterin molybdotransferase MoeA [Lacunisphaera sp.]